MYCPWSSANGLHPLSGREAEVSGCPIHTDARPAGTYARAVPLADWRHRTQCPRMVQLGPARPWAEGTGRHRRSLGNPATAPPARVGQRAGAAAASAAPPGKRAMATRAGSGQTGQGQARAGGWARET